ncbi:NTP/NDP exchange transporter [uncultured Helicobacter sp.]|uniref:NTP/NDP exchange transporter n=1 Tax=uncultured Helicobacter sp. TaxID=175537 RepID=UPI003750B886
MNLLYKIFSVKRGELPLLILSASFIFVLFASYALLRPLRDSLGLEGGEEELKWLFLSTFVATLFASLLAMWLSTKVKRKNYLNTIYCFFALNLLGFYVAMSLIAPHTEAFVWLCRVFYVWVSVFNLFVISSAWSLLADVFRQDSSKRLFGIISAGASLGSIVGAALVSLFVSYLGNTNFIFLSLMFLCLSLALKWLLVKEAQKFALDKEEFTHRFQKPIGSRNPFAGFSLILHSKYLLAFLAFILLLTSVSTFLYMEQARIIKELFPTREARTQAFANIDFIVQTLSFIIQIFFTAKIAELGLRWLLSLLGFVVGVGFVILSFTHPMFLPFVIVMSVRRVGEYALVKPGREMLFVPLDSDSKYKVKNFFDTVVYRGGDALGAQVESAVLKLGVGATLLVGALLSFVWGALGFYLGKRYEKP